MIPELGNFALMLALCLSLALGVIPLLGAARNHAFWLALAQPLARLQCACISLAFLCLAWAFAENDFSVLYVAAHSNSQLPLAYRLCAVWGGHEGSLLLWVLILAGWACAFSFRSHALETVLRARVLAILGWLSFGFLLFLLLTSNPFTRLLPAALEGRELNPLLQDIGMIIHPPMLYMGYVGFSVAFAFALASLMAAQPNSQWVQHARPWTLLAWMFLTLGIFLGSFWAYYELGWGGWWFWDAVENAAFMPWLLGTALIHSLAVAQKRGSFSHWSLLLAIATFSLSLLGTFLVRSGVLTSVHAFATDPRRGIFILLFLSLVVGSALTLFAWRAPRLLRQGSGAHFSLLSREAFLLLNNVLLAVAAASVLLGTLYPLFLDVLGGSKISVGAPYFESVFVPLMLPVLLLMPLAPFLRWQTAHWSQLWAALRWLLLPLVLIGVLASFFATSPMMVVGVCAATWIALGSVAHGWQRARRGGLRSLDLGYLGMLLAHLGIAVFVFGVTMVRSFETAQDVLLAPGESVKIGQYQFQFEAIKQIEGPNYSATQAHFTVKEQGQTIASLLPEKRQFRSQSMAMTEAAIERGLTRDLYLALGEALPQGRWIVRIQIKPFIGWIWAGCLLIALGGVCAASRRVASKTGAALPLCEKRDI